MRRDSRSTFENALRYQAASRSCASARDVCASITDNGVRSSCDASAVNSSCRRRAASTGAATRRPMTTAPANTPSNRKGAIASVPMTIVRCVSSTGDIDSATTTRLPSTCEPAMRTCSPEIVAVCGEVTPWYSAGRSGVVESLVTVPSGCDVPHEHLRAERPVALGSRTAAVSGRPAATAAAGPGSNAPMSRPSIWLVRSTVAHATTAAGDEHVDGTDDEGCRERDTDRLRPDGRARGHSVVSIRYPAPRAVTIRVSAPVSFARRRLIWTSIAFEPERLCLVLPGVLGDLLAVNDGRRAAQE